MSSLHPVIMAGGRGTRFWPASREARPKQFLSVLGEESLLTRTVRRLLPLARKEHFLVITNAAHVELASSQLPELPRETILGEPLGRNTAPCIALAAAIVEREEPGAVLLVAPAEAWIGDEDAFRASAELAKRLADEKGALVTFGILPDSPETGYGYIEAGEARGDNVFEVVRFTEKPDRATAEKFLATRRHFWNSGMFAWRADVFLEELGGTHPEIVVGCREIAGAKDRAAALARVYPKLTSISVDYALLERSKHVYVVRASFPWSDVGSWDALAEVVRAESEPNAVQGDGLAIDSTGCLVHASNRFVVILGVNDLVVIDTPDALLVCPKSRAQDVKKVVEALEKRGRRELL